MAVHSPTRPIEDSVAQVNNEIAVGSDLQFQRRWWIFERSVWILFTVIVILDICGFFGRGPMANARLRAKDGTIDIQYERVERYSTPSILTVHFGPDAIHDGKVQLWVSESFVKGLGNERVVPAPTRSMIGEGGILYTFPADPGPASAEFALQPTAPGVDHLRMRVPGHEEVHMTIYVMP